MVEGEEEGKTMVENGFIAHINGKICIGGGNASSGAEKDKDGFLEKNGGEKQGETLKEDVSAAVENQFWVGVGGKLYIGGGNVTLGVEDSNSKPCDDSVDKELEEMEVENVESIHDVCNGDSAPQVVDAYGETDKIHGADAVDGIMVVYDDGDRDHEFSVGEKGAANSADKIHGADVIDGMEVSVDDDGDQEHEFSVGEFVWGKIRGKSWRPGQISDASDCATSSRQEEDSHLVAFFDGSSAWCHESQLKPFKEYFEEMSKLCASKKSLNAIQNAVNEMSRLVELKMTCSCVSKEESSAFSRPFAGMKKGVLVPEPKQVLGKLKHIAQVGSMSSLLDSMVLKGWLSAFYRAKGFDPVLPLYREPQAIPDLDDDNNAMNVSNKELEEMEVENVESIHDVCNGDSAPHVVDAYGEADKIHGADAVDGIMVVYDDGDRDHEFSVGEKGAANSADKIHGADAVDGIMVVYDDGDRDHEFSVGEKGAANSADKIHGADAVDGIMVVYDDGDRDHEFSVCEKGAANSADKIHGADVIDGMEVSVDDDGDRELEFSVGEFVWGKIRGKSWRPGQISDASDCATSSRQEEDSHLVAFFDGSSAWCHESQLKPFEEYFEEMSKLCASKKSLNAIQNAVNEMSRLVELKMTCSCVSKEESSAFSKPFAGMKKGVLVPEPKQVLGKLKHIAQVGSMSSLLDSMVLKGWLSAFYRTKGLDPVLPLYREPEAIPDLDDDNNAVTVSNKRPNQVEWLISTCKFGRIGDSEQHQGTQKSMEAEKGTNSDKSASSSKRKSSDGSSDHILTRGRKKRLIDANEELEIAKNAAVSQSFLDESSQLSYITDKLKMLLTMLQTETPNADLKIRLLAELEDLSEKVTAIIRPSSS